MAHSSANWGNYDGEFEAQASAESAAYVQKLERRLAALRARQRSSVRGGGGSEAGAGEGSGEDDDTDAGKLWEGVEERERLTLGAIWDDAPLCGSSTGGSAAGAGSGTSSTLSATTGGCDDARPRTVELVTRWGRPPRANRQSRWLLVCGGCACCDCWPAASGGGGNGGHVTLA